MHLVCCDQSKEEKVHPWLVPEQETHSAQPHLLRQNKWHRAAVLLLHTSKAHDNHNQPQSS